MATANNAVRYRLLSASSVMSLTSVLYVNTRGVVYVGGVIRSGAVPPTWTAWHPFLKVFEYSDADATLNRWKGPDVATEGYVISSMALWEIVNDFDVIFAFYELLDKTGRVSAD